MSTGDFHDRGFDEGTLTKLRIFELYAREWLPVFLAAQRPRYPSIHLFDFFAGPGLDAEGNVGSPLRLLKQLRDCQKLSGWEHVEKIVHFYDGSSTKIGELGGKIDQLQPLGSGIKLDLRALEFGCAFREADGILSNPRAAKLVFIDQFGVDHVTPSVFRALVKAPACDFLFFLSSSTLHRFRDHPSIKQKIVRPDDYHHVHRAALAYYQGLLSPEDRYFLAPFSIKKGSNIYGLIFGSAHPLGIDKFLQVAWATDAISGEADFDIHRDNIRPGELLLPLPEMRPSKLAVFEEELEESLRAGRLLDECDVMRVCFAHGVKRQHAVPVLRKLRHTGILETDFRVPDVDRWASPRAIRMKI